MRSLPPTKAAKEDSLGQICTSGTSINSNNIEPPDKNLYDRTLSMT